MAALLHEISRDPDSFCSMALPVQVLLVLLAWSKKAHPMSALQAMGKQEWERREDASLLERYHLELAKFMVTLHRWLHLTVRVTGICGLQIRQSWAWLKNSTLLWKDWNNIFTSWSLLWILKFPFSWVKRRWQKRKGIILEIHFFFKVT